MSLPGWDRQHVPEPPFGWVQWKGTYACVDFTCSCGAGGHIDGSFLYFVRCASCEQAYMVSGYVELVPITPDEAKAEKVQEFQDEDDG